MENFISCAVITLCNKKSDSTAIVQSLWTIKKQSIERENKTKRAVEKDPEPG